MGKSPLGLGKLIVLYYSGDWILLALQDDSVSVRINMYLHYFEGPHGYSV